ncbi:MAG: hypothetical protein CL902_01925, partial [Dehalococcoidia bacterium]|nr:hypothetical protein [Dehalococcoidia bacterium]
MLTLPQTFWKRNRSFKISLLFCILTGLLSGWLIVTLIQDNRQVADDARGNAVQQAVDAAREISLVLDTVPVLADRLSQEIGSGQLADEDVETRFLSLLEANPKVSAITACFSPEHLPDFVVARGDDRYCPFSYTDENGDLFIQRIEDSYDYTLPHGSIDSSGEPVNTYWYHSPIGEGPVWDEPYLGSATGVYWGGYGIPFYRTPADGEVADASGRTPAGTIDVSLTLEQFQTLVGELDFGDVGTGYGFIISKTGDFIYHPESRFVNQALNITDYDPQLSISVINGTSQTEEGSTLSVFNHVDQQSGRESWLVIAPVGPAGWWVGIALDKDSIIQRAALVEENRRREVEIAMAVAAFLFFSALVYIIQEHKGSNRGYWKASIIFSFLAMSGIAYIWVLTLTGSQEPPKNDVILQEQAITSKIVSNYLEDSDKLMELPTGILVESVNFASAHNVEFTGYIWQRYGSDVPESMIPGLTDEVPGFTLPQANIGYNDDVAEVFRRVEDDEVVIGWYFRSQRRQQLDYAHYPFNREDLRIRIWPPDPFGDFLLVPDLASYRSTIPEILPGMDTSELVLGGWKAESSFFSYRDLNLNTNLGQGISANQVVLPELLFHVGLRRQFVDAFISHVIPLLIVASLLFAVLVIVTLRQERIGIFGFSTSNVLAYCAALFFVVVISHISLRDGLDAPVDIVYLEYFYFVIYTAILLL